MTGYEITGYDLRDVVSRQRRIPDNVKPSVSVERTCLNSSNKMGCLPWGISTRVENLQKNKLKKRWKKKKRRDSDSYEGGPNCRLDVDTINIDLEPERVDLKPGRVDLEPGQVMQITKEFPTGPEVITAFTIPPNYVLSDFSDNDFDSLVAHAQMMEARIREKKEAEENERIRKFKAAQVRLNAPRRSSAGIDRQFQNRINNFKKIRDLLHAADSDTSEESESALTPFFLF